MTAANHVAGGAVFTALFASLIFGINVLASPWTIAAAIVSSLLPDIDHTRSTIGKAVYPIAKWINRKFGHRTLTHGFPFMASLIFIIGLAEKTFSGSLTITKVVSLGYFSHLLLDMFTLQGVPLLYPFNRAPFVMIGNPEMRIRTGDYRKETICFFIFIMAGLFMQPLFSKGFWTVWNQNLATMKHLHGEFVRSNDMLSVEYEIVEGLELKKGRGFCIESKSENEAWLLDSAGQWVLLKYPDCRHSLPTHTGRRFSLSSVTLISVSPDSLNRVLAGKIIQKIEVQANQQFQVTERNQFPKQTASFTADHLSQPPLFAAIPSAPSLDTFITDRSYLAEIELLQSEIRRIHADASTARNAQRSHEAFISNLRSQYAATHDITERQRLHDEIETALSSRRELPQMDESRSAELKDRIAKIKAEARLKASAKQTEIEVKNRETLGQLQPLQLTAIVTFVEGFQPLALPLASPSLPTDTIPDPDPVTFRVIGIKDGDTIEAIDPDSSRGTKTSFVIRLAHVDCPEKRQPFGQKAKQFTSDFCFGKQITIQQTDTDRYRRKVCLVYVEGRELNMALVEAGFAWHFKKYSKAQEYADAENAARAARVGLWADEAPVAPWEWRKIH